VTDRCLGRDGDQRWRIRTNRGDDFTASSSRWAPARCTSRSCRASPASRPSRATASTPAAGTTTTPAATRGRAARPARRQARRHHRHRRHRRAVRPAPRARLQGALRLPAHAVVGRRAQQPPDRPGLVRDDREPGWQKRWLENFTACRPAASPTRTWCRTAGPTQQAHPRRRCSSCRRKEFTPARHHGRPTRTPTTRRWTEIRARVDALVEDGRPPRSSSRGTASCASARASTTSTCRPTTSPART
jgi:hypothetical protein